ncbi:hypothetical protein PENTCL1PPCAC_1727, partial [Pristionchus entomophagus]
MLNVSLSIPSLENEMLHEMVDDSFFLELTRACKELRMDFFWINAEALHQLFQSMVEGSAKLGDLISDEIRVFHSSNSSESPTGIRDSSQTRTLRY